MGARINQSSVQVAVGLIYHLVLASLLDLLVIIYCNTFLLLLWLLAFHSDL